MSDRSWIVNRIGEPAFELLASELSGAELQSLLLEVMRRRAHQRSPGDVLDHYLRDRFCSPAMVDLRRSLEVDRHLLAAADRFEALDLSPLAPLGATSAMGRTSQNRVISALRLTEVVSDPTNVLALECARRLRVNSRAAAHLATSQRVVRAQPAPPLPGHSQHFRLFALASGGREAKDHAFTIETVVLHIQTMWQALDRLEENGYTFGARRVDLFAVPHRQEVADGIALRLRPSGATAGQVLSGPSGATAGQVLSGPSGATAGQVLSRPSGATAGQVLSRPSGPTAEQVACGTLDHPYYSGGLRYQIRVTAPDGSELPLIDGGAFDWLAQLTGNRRLVYVASGAGSQLIAWRFGIQP